MKRKFFKIKFGSLFIVCCLFILCGIYFGCDDGSDFSNGIFIDSPVQGLEYVTRTVSGITDKSGRFSYSNGETITFKIGGVVLGSAIAKPVMSPLDLVPGATSVTNDQVTNICRFLQTMDDDDNPENGILISEAVRDCIYNCMDNNTSLKFDMPIDEFETAVSDIVGVLTEKRSAGKRGLVSASSAQSHLASMLGINNPQEDEPGATGGVSVGDVSDIDNDGDGYTENQGDCNDNDASIYPGASEICGDGIDQDCNGSDLVCQTDPNDVDDDGDGYTENQGDCDDNNQLVYPGAPEQECDGIDQNCDGEDFCQQSDECIDNDGDGFYASENCGTAKDCNDNDASIYPGAPEQECDGIDQNCDGEDFCQQSDECIDNDGDGFYASENCGTAKDCNDNDASIYPGASEICGDNIDQDCNGSDLSCNQEGGDDVPPTPGN